MIRLRATFELSEKPKSSASAIERLIAFHLAFDQFAIASGIPRGAPLALSLISAPTDSEITVDFTVPDIASSGGVVNALFQMERARGDSARLLRMCSLHPNYPPAELWTIEFPSPIVDLPYVITIEDLFAEDQAEPDSLTLSSVTPICIASSAHRHLPPLPITARKLIASGTRQLALLLGSIPRSVSTSVAEADAANADLHRFHSEAHCESITYRSSAHRNPIEIAAWSGTWTWQAPRPDSVRILRAALWCGLGGRSRLGFGQFTLSTNA